MSRAAWCISLVLAAALAGCSKPNKTVEVKTPDGAVTVTGDGGMVEVTGKDGSISRSSSVDGKTVFEGTDASGKAVKAEGGKNVDMSGLGVPQYPGATLKDEGSQLKVETSTGATHGVTLITPDPPQKVVDWYKGQLTDATSMNMPEGAMVMGKSKGGQQVTVTASSEAGKTTIGIVTLKGQ
ncbi:MAG: hypothetical protein NT029_21530 [Armatimonadetes bacterium]|nr:hypothetical protein [Armatimonadota bacterium]